MPPRRHSIDRLNLGQDLPVVNAADIGDKLQAVAVAQGDGFGPQGPRVGSAPASAARIARMGIMPLLKRMQKVARVADALLGQSKHEAARYVRHPV